MDRIRIHLGEQGWLATYSGPHAERALALFGKTTIETGWTSTAPIGQVVRETRLLNPGAHVAHWLEG
jgi:hypothetical protein